MALGGDDVVLVVLDDVVRFQIEAAAHRTVAGRLDGRRRRGLHRLVLRLGARAAGQQRDERHACEQPRWRAPPTDWPAFTDQRSSLAG